jgi:hypothetical protein
VVGLVALGAVSFSGLAVADDISNSLDASIDAVAEVMPLTVGGANGTTQLFVTPRNGDGKSGCNLTGASTLGLSVSSDNAAVATVSPSTVTFASCGDTKTLTVTPVSAGSATVSVAQTSNNTGGSFNLAPATFTVNVTPPPNTAPTIAVIGVAGGAIYHKGSVPSATCQVTDAEDGNSSFPATLSPVTGDYASDGIGSQTAHCSYTDAGGLKAISSETYSIVDPSAPVIGYTLNPATPDGDSEWYKSNVSLNWSVSEPQSPNSLQKTDCVDQNIISDQQATAYSCSATSAGGTAAEQTVTVKRDATAPTVAYDSHQGTLGSNGWYTSAVDVTFKATDTTSGVNPATKTASSSSQGEAVTVESPAFTDAAGNTTAAGAATESYKIDTTDPSEPVFVGGAPDYFFGDTQTKPTCTSTDAVSGLSSCEVTGGGTTVGTHTYTATATDNAGNTSNNTTTYEVKPWTMKGFYSPVDMGSVVNTVKGGSTVPLKFELFAGANEKTTVDAVKSFTTAKTNCASGVPADEIEILSTGGTSLRYDTTGGQFIQNWKTPTGAGCYSVKMTAVDGSTITALFKTR